MPSAVDHYRCTGDSDSIDAGDVCVRLSSCRANPNSVRLRIGTARVADIDIVIARGEIEAGVMAQGDVVVASVVLEERTDTVCGVVVAGSVAIERLEPVSRVGAAGVVGKERFKAKAGIPLARSQASENSNAISVVVIGQRTIRICGLRIWQKPKAGQRERDE